MIILPQRVPEAGFYYHYKHDPDKGVRDYAYEVLSMGFHTENPCPPGEECSVIYRPLYESAAVYQASKVMGVPATDKRPLEMFMSKVDSAEFSYKGPCFIKIADPAVISELEKVRTDMYPS